MGSCRRLLLLGCRLPQVRCQASWYNRKLGDQARGNWTNRQHPKLCPMSQKHHAKESSSSTTVSDSLLVRYLRGFKWIAIPFGVGFAYLAYLRYCYTSKHEKAKLTSSLDPNDFLASDFEIFLYRMLPLKMMSRWFGWFSELSLPNWLRSPLLRTYAKAYGCNVQEAEVEDLAQYSSLGEFFRRALKPGVRTIHQGDCLVSPADGTVLHFGPVVNEQIEQVKDITYSLTAFLGPVSWCSSEKEQMLSKDVSYMQRLLRNKNTQLYQCVIYLAPGDYHRFHSPADWSVQYRRHFPGDLLSVNPGFVSWIAGLFNLNERVAYIGQWEHGFFGMVAVGATTVGSVRVYFDEDLTTNCRKLKKGAYQDKTFSANNNFGVRFQKGDPFGEFNFGSTIVVIMEAPKDFQFQVEPGQKVQYGKLLSQLCQHKKAR